MSLSIDGFWKAGFWSQTFWADGFWYEGEPVPPEPVETNNFGGVKRRHPKVIIERDYEEEKEEIAEVVRKVKRLIARKITNKQTAQKVQTEVIQAVQYQGIDLSQAQILMDSLKEQDIKARIRLKQLKDDELAIKLLLG